MLKTAGPPEQKVEPIDMLRERLRPAIRSAAVGVAAAGWSYRDALDDLIADHVLPVLRQFPELEPRFDSLEAGVGNALANAVQRLQGEIQRDGEALGKRYQREGTVMSDRVAGSGLTEAEKRQVAAREGGWDSLTPKEQMEEATREEARWKVLEQTPEYQEMASHLEEQIAGSATGEVGRLSVDQGMRERPNTEQTREAAAFSFAAEVDRRDPALSRQVAATLTEAEAKNNPETTLVADLTVYLRGVERDTYAESLGSPTYDKDGTLAPIEPEIKAAREWASKEWLQQAMREVARQSPSVELGVKPDIEQRRAHEAVQARSHVLTR